MSFDDMKPVFGTPMGPWIRCFAWLPTFTADAGHVWLRFVWKRHVMKKMFLDGGSDWWFQYRRFNERKDQDQ